jgi:ABC-type molybdenum transport system ATPase subunit/photorepair protein PhrA
MTVRGPAEDRQLSDELAIEVSGLVKSYRDVRVLSGVDLRVPRGSVFALLGPNGAGKPVTELRHSLLARPADCRSRGRRSSSRTRPPSWTYCVRERSATRC